MKNHKKINGDLLLSWFPSFLPAWFLSAGGGLGGGGPAMVAWLLVFTIPKVFLQSGFKLNYSIN